eukprot:1435786-Alexandrium_andersonii.AAC.1
MAAGGRASPLGRHRRGRCSRQRGSPPALTCGRRGSLRGPSPDAATLPSGPTLRQAIDRLVPAFSTMAFDVLQRDLPLRLDVPEQGLGVVDQVQ